MKYCPKCKQNKSFNDFYIRKRGSRAGKYYEKCKFCMRERGIKYYSLNRKRQLGLAIKRRHRYYKLKREFIDSFKNKPCQDCGEIYPPYVMDFDHKDGKIKVGNIASMTTRNLSLGRIKEEIEKCDIVCANCHRIRTFKRLAEVAKVVTAGV